MAWNEASTLQTLKSAHENIALLEAKGCNDTQICEVTGYSMAHISRIRNNAPGYAVLLSELDRAPEAPKRVHRQENLEEHKIIFGVQTVDNMKKALTHVGADEVIDLLEGEDFTVEDQMVINVDDD